MHSANAADAAKAQTAKRSDAWHRFLPLAFVCIQTPADTAQTPIKPIAIRTASRWRHVHIKLHNASHNDSDSTMHINIMHARDTPIVTYAMKPIKPIGYESPFNAEWPTSAGFSFPVCGVGAKYHWEAKSQ